MPPYLHAFIDESGTPGGRGDNVSVVGGLIVPSERLDSVRQEVMRLRHEVHPAHKGDTPPILHFSKMKDRNRERVTSAITSMVSVKVSCVVIVRDALAWEGGHYGRDASQEVAMGYLIERFSWIAAGWGRPLRLTVAAWGRYDTDKLRFRLDKLRSSSAHCRAQLNMSCCRVMPMGHEPCLELADAAVSSTRKGFVGSPTSTDTRWLEILSPRIYRGAPNPCPVDSCNMDCLRSYGLKAHPWNDRSAVTLTPAYRKVPCS